MTLRLFRPPIRAIVQITGTAPGHVAFRGMRGEIVMASGPWRTSGDWWAEDGWERDEWDVEVEFCTSTAPAAIPQQGPQPYSTARQTPTPQNAAHTAPGGPTNRVAHGVFRIYQELATGHWFVRGAYD
jgi:hypothetical protein